MIKRHKVIGSTIRTRNLETKTKVMDDLSNEVMPLFDSGTLKPIIYKVLSFDDCEKAHSIMEADENIGKIILNLD